MNKIKAALTRFMSGRYGMDLLNKVLMITAFALAIIGSAAGLPALSLISMVVMGYTIFRAYSRDHSKRVSENRGFTRFLKRIRNSFLLFKLRVKEVRTHRHVKCPGCGVIIRTSTERGVRHLSCPKCGKEFETKIRI